MDICTMMKADTAKSTANHNSDMLKKLARRILVLEEVLDYHLVHHDGLDMKWEEPESIAKGGTNERTTG